MARKRKSDQQRAADVAIGAQIERARERRGVTAGELAARLELSYYAVYCYETGATAVSTARLMEIAHALRCDLRELVPVIV